MGVKLSLIVPVYNVEKYVGDCIRSIMEQTYSNFECLIVDDCGTDSSISIIEKELSGYSGCAEFVILRHEKNRGISAARNTALKQASGDYIFFIDSDDKLFPNSLELLVRTVEKYPGIDVVQGNIKTEAYSKYWTYSEDRFPRISYDREWITQKILHWGIPISVWSKLYRRDFIVENGIEFLEEFMHEDVMWTWYIQKYIKSMAFISDFCYWYRTDNNSSLMHRKDKTYSLVSFLEIYKIISLQANSVFEKRYLFHLLPPTKKVQDYTSVRDISVVESKLNETIGILNAKGVDKFLILQLRLWYLPSWIISNKFFSKLYYLWGCRHNMMD